MIYDTGQVSIGTIRLTGGTGVSWTQYVGVRFQAEGTYSAAQIGGHFGGATGASVFGAIVELTGPTALPDLAHLEFDPGLVAVAVFSVPARSEVTWGDLSGQIIDGAWYELVFGTGLFGAVGEGFTPYQDVSVNTFADSMWYVPQTGVVHQVASTLGYFGLRGDRLSVPEPATLTLGFLALAALIATHRRHHSRLPRPVECREGCQGDDEADQAGEG